MIDIKLTKPGQASIDECHASLILGTALSTKPNNLLEIGIGTGFITNTLLYSIEYNQMGFLTAVDNYQDLGGNLKHDTIQQLQKNKNLKLLCPIQEKDFVLSSNDDSYDFLVSDGDHHNAGDWVEEIFRIMKPNAFIFLHDINNKIFPGLMNYKTLADKYNKPNYLFYKSSIEKEMCDRGLLMIINNK